MLGPRVHALASSRSLAVHPAGHGQTAEPPVTLALLTGGGHRSRMSTHSIAVRTFAGHRRHTEGLDALKVVHLSDLHVGRVTPLRVQMAAARMANELAPDLVVITGDFVCHSQAYLEDLTEVMRSFRTPVLGVLGNHDHWSGAQEVEKALRRGGVEVLNNAHTVLTLRGQKLNVVGLNDAYTGHADRERAVRGLDARLPTLGLSHIAEEADGLWARGVPLVLSGHTHAGQITWARLHELALGRLMGHRYVHGLYGSRDGDGAVYVGAGIGASVMPLRLGERARRELTVFNLGAPPGHAPEHHAEQPPHPGRAPSQRTRQKRAAAVQKKAADRARRR